MATIINKYGKLNGWSRISFRMLNQKFEGVTEIAYDDNLAKENVYATGNYPVGRGEGNYEATASMTFLDEDIQRIQAALPAGKRLQDIEPFDITVAYELPSGVLTDVIRNVEFTKNTRGAKQGDVKIERKQELVISHIDWNQ